MSEKMNDLPTEASVDVFPKIKVVQYMHGNFGYFNWSEKINRRYCERHGYDYVVSREIPRDDRHVAWHKVPVILKELRDCDYLLFLDADAIFYSQELTIEDELLPLLGNKLILMAQDFRCETIRDTPGHPNSGVILAKVEKVTGEFFECWNQATEIDESSRWTWPPDQLGLWRVVLPKFSDILHVHPDYYMFQGLYGQYIRQGPQKGVHQCTSR